MTGTIDVPGTVEHPIRGVVLNDERVPWGGVPTTFLYEALLPFQVTVSMFDGCEWVSWVFARDLLAEGLQGPAGAGDVVVYPWDDAHVVVGLRSAEGVAALRYPHRLVASFVAESFALVGRGCESAAAGVSAELDALLREWAS